MSDTPDTGATPDANFDKAIADLSASLEQPTEGAPAETTSTTVGEVVLGTVPAGTVLTDEAVAGMVDALKPPLAEQLAAVAEVSAAAVAPSTSAEPDPAVVAVTETKVYADGTVATGPGPLPDESPAEAKADIGLPPAPSADAIAEANAQVNMTAEQQAQIEALHAVATAGMEREAGLHSNVTEVERARELLEAGAGEPLATPVYAPGSIQRFMDDDGKGNRDVKAILVNADGDLRKALVD